MLRARSLVLSPPLAGFAVLFAAAEAVKFLRGDALWGTIDLVLAVLLAFVCALTRWFTRDDASPGPVTRGRALPLQLLACAVVLAATGLGPLVTYHDVPSWLHVPLWDSARRAIFDAAARFAPLPIANGIANFSAYCLPIGAVLLVLGVPLGQQGLGKFRKGSVASAVAWLALPLGVFAYAWFAGRASPISIAYAWLSNFLQNGVSEEFLWRGAVLGRLRAVMKPEYAIFVQALLFGAWHAGADLNAYHGDALNAAADMVASQATFGLAAAYVTLRTGNIAIASAFHLLFDSMQILQ
ncbi:MAG TPA: CPBP family intramembrane glutamic endopeptidase [Verrucomicrobiae bacterium]|nr:CPBP family intramembrane glutamic endopeptidase [Verrucomicrobiae bacterium]